MANIENEILENEIATVDATPLLFRLAIGTGRSTRITLHFPTAAARLEYLSRRYEFEGVTNDELKYIHTELYGFEEYSEDQDENVDDAGADQATSSPNFTDAELRAALYGCDEDEPARVLGDYTYNYTTSAEAGSEDDNTSNIHSAMTVWTPRDETSYNYYAWVDEGDDNNLGSEYDVIDEEEDVGIDDEPELPKWLRAGARAHGG